MGLEKERTQMSGEDGLAAVMGFTSFGAPRRATRRSQAGRRRRRHRVLPQVLPGTELHGKVSLARTEEGPSGLVWLVSTTTEHEEEEEDEGNEAARHNVPYARVMAELLAVKRQFAHVAPSSFAAARAATNPFERLGRARFVSRAALKLVALDHICHVTRPRATALSSTFTFVDLCGGPGGFSEYLVWKTRRRGVRGYGITLRDAANACDWRLPRPVHNVVTLSYGHDGTGNLDSVANRQSFCHLVRQHHAHGVDLVVADGGCAHARAHVDQERSMMRLVLAEVLTMFHVLGADGDFVCKTFELTTRASLELCWLVHACFGRMALVKPITSRPASSERYLVARGLRATSPLIPTAIHVLQARLDQRPTDNMWHVPMLPPTTRMRHDADFHAYMTAANEAIARTQLDACKRILDYVKRKKR
ncbi:hypothetical protein PsorP6_000824 [Peronosclerospora sorghi]|uniref:Uncharacterized protein n=1 Tax=Peronosclerospora sorghi TaxID=230839 RepID=A0ACC0WSF2_9STRA|nr:hypothetical protein PsorP6_000824 [Peronosclerospora sorghi]